MTDMLDPKACNAQLTGASCGGSCGGPNLGAFVHTTAFRTADVAALSAAICRYAEAHGVVTTEVPVSDEFASNTLLFQPQNGWTVVFWPDYFLGHDVAAALALSRELHVVASVVFVEDGRYWAHVLVENGAVVDRFCPHPGRVAQIAPAAEWCGEAALQAQKFGVPVADLAPYLRDLDAAAEAAKPPKPGFFARFFAPEPPPFAAGPAFPDDEYDLDDYDVFVDFWRRAGIHWPADMELATPAYSWRFADDYAEKLPK